MLLRELLSSNFDDLMPPPERYIFNFHSKKELNKWHLYSDSELGGLSTASMEIAECENGPTTGIFWETFLWMLLRVLNGTFLVVASVFDGFINLDSYDTIAMKIKGDGRCYISTIYTENWINSPEQMEDNSWQAFVYVPKDNWYIAKIPLARYLPTWRGNVIDVEIEMNPSRVLGMSLSVNNCFVLKQRYPLGDLSCSDIHDEAKISTGRFVLFRYSRPRS